jgi:signal transduction histidine kinase
VKLLNKTTLYYIIISFIIFLVGGLVFYHTIKSVVYRQLDETLVTEQQIIEEEIDHLDSVPDFTTRFGHQIEVAIYNHPFLPSVMFHDTLVKNDSTNARIMYRHLLGKGNSSKGQGYEISIYKPLAETVDLIDKFVFIIVVLFIALLFILISVNYVISRTAWIPFYSTLRKLNRYDLSDNTILNFDKTSISEIKKLNNVLENMSEKIKKDYINLKEYTENISHEVQTPIAIIRNKLELLIQSENLDKNQLQMIEAVSQAANRLSKLNQNLMLLTRIENLQFGNAESIDIGDLIDKYLGNLEELIDMKKLVVTKEFHVKTVVKINNVLADTLISNLLSNSIKHNIEGGSIRISLKANELVIANTGQPLHLQPAELFERFKKANKQSASLGLGLTIVKKIADLYHFQIEYLFKEGIHTIKIKFFIQE